MIQLQIDANASRGPFDIYFFNQASQSGWDRWQIDPGTGALKFSESKGGSTNQFVDRTIGAMKGTVTVNILIQGGSYTLYTNGTNQGNAISSSYTSGGMGLGAEPGAQVSVKNVAIYAALS